ncbi:MAG: DNA-3-methyladenine glycosylase 2 family protein [Paracoccaceae bacterium]|nr:DNA-3-methyladenine glycosylase 2 family protein [Paracoccaceae bacterium]
MLIHRLIQTEADLADGMSWLAAQEPLFASAFAATGPLPLRDRPDGFASLLSAIISQQLSVASAAAIWERLQQADLTAAHTIALASDDGLRAVGLSRQKIRYARALAASGIDFIGLRKCEDAQVVELLTDVSGIGVWTAEIYAMFSLSRADIFAPGDLALQEATRSLFDLPERPKERALRDMAEAWSPWRSVAARLLWSYYRVIKNREGIV